MNEQATALVLNARDSLKRAGRLRRWARLRPRSIWAFLLLPSSVSLLVDLARRGPRILDFSWLHLGCYLSSWLLVTLVWATSLYAVAAPGRWVRRSATLLFVATFTLVLGAQTYFYDQYRSYVNRDISLFAQGMLDSIFNQFLIDVSGFTTAALPFLVVATALVVFARFAFRPRRGSGRHAFGSSVVLLLVACAAPVQYRQWQAAPPEALYFNAMGGFALSSFGLTEEAHKTRPRTRHSLPVPELSSLPARPRNVVLVITESVRADAFCNRYDPECVLTPHTNRLLPERHALDQLRALDSTTATSLAVLWSGLLPNASTDQMHSWPLLFDYANAAGWDTAFWTSQNLMFGNSRLWVANLGARLTVSATELDPEADVDLGVDEGLFADHVEANWSELREPFLAVIQLSNTHYPYYVNETRDQPFQPAAFAKGPDEVELFKNFYQNAVVQQDEHVASMLRALRQRDVGQRTVIVYTSDHGEAFREHHQLGHTFSLYDEEIKVPGFVDAPRGTLSELERKQLLDKARLFTTHADVAPTVLDLMGVWDDRLLDTFKAKMRGSSWLRPRVVSTALPMTNCSAVWSCAFENWGMMRGSLKVLARTPYDLGWRCYDLARDAFERTPLKTEECAALRLEALQEFGRLPQ